MHYQEDVMPTDETLTAAYLRAPRAAAIAGILFRLIGHRLAGGVEARALGPLHDAGGRDPFGRLAVQPR
jgi:hypothetical protein